MYPAQDIDVAAVAKLKVGVGLFLGGLEKQAPINDACNASESQYGIELRNAKRPESIVSAQAVANQLVEFGAEHLSAFDRATQPPVEAMACWTGIRSMLEACSIANWLIDVSIGSRERISRCFAYRYSGMDQQKKLLRSQGGRDELVKRLEARIVELEYQALALGYTQISDKKGNVAGLAERMPTATSLIRQELNEEPTYRLLSAVAHGHTWAISQIGYRSTEEDVGIPGTSTVSVQSLEKSVCVAGILYLGIVGINALARPLVSQYRYMGWDQDKLADLLDGVYEVIGANPRDAFWRA